MPLVQGVVQMALLMAKLKRSTTGAYVARKVIPKVIRSEYAVAGEEPVRP